jgi:hypothetical protein
VEALQRCPARPGSSPGFCLGRQDFPVSGAPGGRCTTPMSLAKAHCMPPSWAQCPWRACTVGPRLRWRAVDKSSAAARRRRWPTAW